MKFLKKCINWSILCAATALSPTMDRMMASRRSRSQIPLQESKELIYFPSPGKSCSAYNEILFANQNQSSSTALSSPDLVVLQPFQPWNWKTLLKQINAMANSNFGYNLDFCSPNKKMAFNRTTGRSVNL